MPTPPIAALAAHLAGVSAATVPEAVRDRAGLVLADTLGAIVAGQGDPAVAATARRHATGGPCRLPGTGLRAAPPMAAFLNGFAGTALELDEGNYPAGGHPGVHAVAAALAEAEALGADGALLLDAVIAGYEAGARVGMATRLRPAAHPHGTWGAIGAAAAVARLRGHDAATMRRVLEVAASLGLSTSATAALRGGSVRNAYAGVAAQNGVLACDLVEAGVTSEPGGIAAVFGGVVGEAFDERAAVAGLGERWLIAEAFFKRAACCRETQGALEAIELLLDEAPVPPGDVEAIEVETFASAAALAERAPPTPIAGRFSIPFAVATRVVRGHAWTDAFSEEAIADPETRALAARVSVREAPALTARLPAERVCRLSLRPRGGGAVRRKEVVGTPGDPDRPLPEEALREKFRRCAEPALGARWEAAWRAARRPDGVSDLAALF